VDGFQYLRNRWYDPGTGRFTQEDPIGFAGGVNLYAYAGSNPVMYTDPFGLCKEGDTYCERVRDFFQEHGGAGGRKIATALDDNSWKLNPTERPRDPNAPNPSRFVGGSTNLETKVIDVNNRQSFGQQIAAINHEFWQHAFPGRPGHSTSGDDPWAQREALTLSSMRNAPGIRDGVYYYPHVDAAAQRLGIRLPEFDTRGIPIP
jgi:uncharacterized protein RhaS with RHS repeats